MKRIWFRVGLAGLLLALAAALVFFVASSWLETPAGRELLQRELGNGLGVAASMRGEYVLEMFPGLHISGKQMELRKPSTGQVLASLESYQLHLALWPLLKQQVVIFKMAASDGLIDLDLLAGPQGRPDQGGSAPARLPTIKSLELANLRILKSGTEMLAIDDLQLDDFVDGQDAALALGISMPHDEAATSLLEFRGTLRLELSPLSAAVGIDGASIRINEQAWPLGAGKFDWSSETGVINAGLRGMQAGFSGQLEFMLATQPGLALSATVQLVSPDGSTATASFTATDISGIWEIRPAGLMLDGQQLEGQGCLELETRPRLQLELQSTELDLDRLRSLIPAGALAGRDGEGSSDPGLPLDVAVEVRVGKVRMAGAEATNVRLLLGSEPDCSLIMQGLPR